jgi:hypothetical protein
MIEILLIQHFLLFLGEPIYRFAVVLAGLLVFTDVGSCLVGRFRDRARSSIMWIIPTILLVLLLTAVGLPWILAAALGFPLLSRIAIVVAMLAPLGFVLGMPFPTGLRIVAIEAPAFVTWAWGVNGFFTVIGSIAASILGMAVGFTQVLAISGACYLTALLAITFARAADLTPDRINGGSLFPLAIHKSGR